MAEVIIHNELAERLQRIAQRENRPVEAVLQSLLELYSSASERPSTEPAEPPSDPLADMDGMFDDDITDLSTTVRATMAAFYREKYGRPD